MAEEETNNVETKEEKENFFKRHPKATFWSRFFLWTTFAWILPVTFIIWRFELFSGSSMSFGGWGLVAILITFFFLRSLIRYVNNVFKIKNVFVAQCITGLCKIIFPLIVLFLAVYSIRNNLNAFIQALGAVIVCELVAIPLNPMPKWIADNVDEKDKERIKGLSDIVWDKFFEKKKEGEE